MPSPTLTIVADTLYDPTGELVNGYIYISNPTTFISPDGYEIPQGTTLKFPVTNGVLDFGLVPNIGATPIGTSYLVRYSVTSQDFTETWVVPRSDTPVPLTAVRTLTPPVPAMMFSVNEVLPPAGMTSGEVLGWNGTEWVAASAGGDVNSVFGRTGTVLALVGDYASFYDALGAAATAQSNAETFTTSAVAVETARAEAAEALLVPQLTTVNGHALTGNIVISASDLTTGTLPHAQLPALVSGDIPNNAANTTGTAGGLSGSPSISITNLTVTGTTSFAAGSIAYAALSGTPTIPTSFPWNMEGNATGNLVLANAGFSSTFNQTSGVNWTWANTTPTVTGASSTLALTQATLSGSNTIYTFAALSGATSNGWVGASVIIAGFSNAGNNGTFVITASTNTTFTVANASGVNETHAATAISSAVVLSPAIILAGTCGSGTNGASEVDSWTIQTGTTQASNNNATPTGPNPKSALIFTHSGSSTVPAYVVVPALQGPVNGNLILDANGNGTGIQFTMQGGTYQQGSIGWGSGGGAVVFGMAIASANSGMPLFLEGYTGATANAVCLELINNSAATMNPVSGTTIGLDIGNGAAANGLGSMNFRPTTGSASFVAAQITPIIDSTAVAVSQNISNAVISSATAAQVTVTSNTGVVAGNFVVIAGITNANFTQLNGTWKVASVSGTTLINLTGTSWTTESSTALTAGTLTQTPGTYTGLLVNVTETAVPSVAANLNMLIDTKVGGTRVWGITNKGHEIVGAANNDGSGSVSSVSGTTVSVAYTHNYNSTPVVTVTPTTNAGAFYLSASSNSGFTIAYANSGAQTFNYMVVGNPN